MRHNQVVPKTVVVGVPSEAGGRGFPRSPERAEPVNLN